MNFEELRGLNNKNVNLGENLNISPDVTFYIKDGGELVIEDGVCIGKGTHIEVYEGAKMVLMANTNIGMNCYISSMCGIVMGEGAAISNMVDLHDHNHNIRDIGNLPNGELDCCASGFSMAPIIIENGAIVSNKCTLTAGVRVGQNSLIGANSAVTKSVKPNCVSAGTPSKTIKTFLGKTSRFKYPHETKVAFFGTSLTQHLEACTPEIYDQMNLPNVDSRTLVTEWRKRGFVAMLENRFMVSKPHLNIDVKNFGKGGANSYEILEEIEKSTSEEQRFDISFLECGTNDILRKFQKRYDEAVELDEYCKNYRAAIERLLEKSRKVICMSMPPVNNEFKEAMNKEIYMYNCEIKKIAQEYNCLYVDVYTEFSRVSYNLNNKNSSSLWSDGLHLSELGDTVISELIFNELEKFKALDLLYTLPKLTKEESIKRYKLD